ncbi:MAG: plasmid maintenance system antidote protein [Moheibacter sp.]
MKFKYLKYKGIHPGIILERELKNRSLKQRPFSLSMGEHPQTFNAIIKGRRNIPISLALKIDKELGLEEGTFALLQTYYDIKIEKQKFKIHSPNLNILRRSLFWDTDIDSIDWDSQFKSVIRRVYERGNEEEKNEINQFYGKTKVNAALSEKKTKPMQIQALDKL